MAHKKAGGSTRNGRDSEAKRLGVKMYGGQVIRPATSSCVSAAPNSTLATALAWVKITPCSLKSKA
jgi:hypothetical protein